MSRVQPDGRGAIAQRLEDADNTQPVIIDSDLTFKGELRFAGETDLVVLGSMSVTSVRGVRKLSIGKHGRLCGEVQSTTADIAGTLDGRATVTDTAFVRRTARLHGEVSARWVSVEKGTNLEGSVLSGTIRRAAR